jgi:hypothetical protein
VRAGLSTGWTTYRSSVSSSPSISARSFPWAAVIGWIGLVLAAVGFGTSLLAVLAYVDYQVHWSPTWMQNEDASVMELFFRVTVCLVFGLPSALVALAVGVAQWVSRSVPAWRPRVTSLLSAAAIATFWAGVAVAMHSVIRTP